MIRGVLQHRPPGIDHCDLMRHFVRPGVDPSRAYELADAARQTLADQVVTLHDYETMGERVIGSATLLKPEVEDHTRRDVDAGWHRLTHLLVTVAAVAEEA